MSAVDSLFRRRLFALVVVAFVLRFAWAIIIPVIPNSDGQAYQTFAQNLAAGHGYCWEPGKLTAYWAVGAPAVFGLIFWLTNGSLFAIAFYNVVVGTFSVWLTVSLARKLTSDDWLPLIAGWIIAIWPSQIQFVTTFNSELTFVFLVLVALNLYVRDDRKMAWGVPEGIVLGLACLVRPIALLLPIVLMISAVGQGKTPLPAIRRCVVNLIACVAVVMPWALRNQAVFGEFVLVSTNRGPNLWMGNHLGTDGGYAPLPEEYVSLPEPERDRTLNRIAVQYIKSHPVEFLKRTAIKFIRLHERETIGVHWNTEAIEKVFGAAMVKPLKIASTGYWLLQVVSAIAGMFVLGRRTSVRCALFHPAFLVWMYFASVHAVIVIQDRYHFPAIPMIAILSSFSFDAIRRFRAVQGVH